MILNHLEGHFPIFCPALGDGLQKTVVLKRIEDTYKSYKHIATTRNEWMNECWTSYDSLSLALTKFRESGHFGWLIAAVVLKSKQIYSPNCSMASLPVYSSAEMIPSAANIAKRPLLSSRSLVGTQELSRGDTDQLQG